MEISATAEDRRTKVAATIGVQLRRIPEALVITIAHYGAAGDISGVTTWMQGLISRLHQHGMSPDVLLPHFSPALTDCSLLNEIQGNARSIAGVRVPFEAEAFTRWTLEQLNELRPAVFVPQCLPALHYAADIAGRQGLPWVLTLHSDAGDYWALASLTGPTAALGVWVAVSEFIANRARLLNPSGDIRTIPYGVPVAGRLARWNAGVFRIAYCGRMLEEQKRISLVTATLIESCRLNPLIEGVMIGDGPNRTKAEQLVAAAGLSSRIRFMGRLAGEELHNALSDCHAILLMSDYEGLPVSLLEGMALGLVPMARWCQSGIPELVRPGETGLLLADDPGQAAVQIAYWVRDGSLWEAASVASHRLITEKYSRDVCLEKWRDLLLELSARCKAKYPLQIPSPMKLPPADRRLYACDWRKLTIPQKVGFRIRRILRRFQRPKS